MKKKFVVYSEDEKGVRIAHTSKIDFTTALQIAQKFAVHYGHKIYYVADKKRIYVEYLNTVDGTPAQPSWSGRVVTPPHATITQTVRPPSRDVDSNSIRTVYRVSRPSQENVTVPSAAVRLQSAWQESAQPRDY